MDLAILHANATAEYRREMYKTLGFQYCLKTSRYKANITKIEIISGLNAVRAEAARTVVANIGIAAE